MSEVSEQTPTPEQGEESIRQLTIALAKEQLEIMGYKKIVEQGEEWLRTNNRPDLLQLIGSSKGIEQRIDEIYQETLDYLSSQIKLIPNSKEARGLLAAALFGFPMGGEGSEMLLSYQVAAPSSGTIQTQFDPNKDSKDFAKPIPNFPGTKLLIGRIAQAGFIKEGNVPLDVIRQTQWQSYKYQGVNGLLELTITPPVNQKLKAAKSPKEWAYTVQVQMRPK